MCVVEIMILEMMEKKEFRSKFFLDLARAITSSHLFNLTFLLGTFINQNNDFLKVLTHFDLWQPNLNQSLSLNSQV